jgi:hypothetical protein
VKYGGRRERAATRRGTAVLTVAFFRPMHRELKRIARAEGITINELVRRAVAQWLDRRALRRVRK